MADKKELLQNVYVDGTWYGPDYPDAKVTADVLKQVTNPAAFEPGKSYPTPEATKLVGESKDAPAEQTAAPADNG